LFIHGVRIAMDDINQPATDLQHVIARIRACQPFIDGLTNDVVAITHSDQTITDEHLATAWSNLAFSECTVVYGRFLEPGAPVSYKLLALRAGITEPAARSVATRVMPKLVLEIWAAITGFSGLPSSRDRRHILNSLSRLGVTSPTLLRQREWVIRFIDAPVVGSHSISVLANWLAGEGIDMWEQITERDVRDIPNLLFRGSPP